MRQLVYLIVVSVTAFATVAVGATAFAVSLIPVDVPGRPQATPPIAVKYDPELVVPNRSDANPEGLAIADPVTPGEPDVPNEIGPDAGNPGNAAGNNGLGNDNEQPEVEQPEVPDPGGPGSGNNGVGAGNGGGNGTGNEGDENPGNGTRPDENPGDGTPPARNPDTGNGRQP